MPRLTLTESSAHAIGWDAGNAHMRAAGREHWDESDYAAACAKWVEMAGYIPGNTRCNPRTLPDDDFDQT